MSDELFNLNRLNKKILSLIGDLYELSSYAQEIIEEPSEATADAITDTIKDFSDGSEAMLNSLTTLLKRVQNSEDEDIDVTVGEQGLEL